MHQKPFVIEESSVKGIPELCGLALDLVNPDNSDSQTVSVATIVVNPGASSRLHYHKVMEEIYYFIEGEGRVRLDDVWHPIRAGSCIYIPPHVLHQIENRGAKSMRLISIDTPPFDPADIYFPDNDSSPHNTK